MTNEFKRLSINTTMSMPAWASGHTGDHAMPCVVTALYSEKTGAIILETIFCNGSYYDLLQVDSNDLRKFYALLAQESAERYF